MSLSRNAPRRGTPGRVRIIGGQYRSRRLQVPDRPGLRPTPDRVRETLFNWLGQSLAGCACLDLYAGSGALGFEAASRGASRVVMVERDRVALEALERNRAALGSAAVEIVAADALAWLGAGRSCFDVVFLDPPFGQNSALAALGRLAERLCAGARVYVEAGAPVVPPAGYAELRRARAGAVSCQLLGWCP